MSITGIRAARAYVELVMNDKKFLRGLQLAESEMRAFANRCTLIGTQAFGMGAAMAAPIAYAAKQFAALDDTMRLVRAVTRATIKDFQTLSDKARLLGKTTSFTSQQVADAMANLGRAGFDPRQIDKMISHVMNLARATQTSIAASAEIVGNAIRQFNLDAKDAQRIVDVMTTTANNSSQTLLDIANSFKYASPIAKEFGMAIEDTAYYIGILANQGLKGEMAGTSLRNMLIRLSGPETVKKFQDELQVQIRDSQHRVKNLKQLLDEVGAAMNARGWDQLQRAKWLRDVFGLRAIAGGAKMTSVGDDMKYIMDAIADSEGAAERTAKQMDEGLGGAIRITVSAFQELANVIGEAVSPELIQLGKWLQGVTNSVITYLKFHRELVVGWSKAAAVLAGGGAALFTLASFLRTVGGLFFGIISGIKNAVVYFKAFSKATGSVDDEMAEAGSAARKAGTDFVESAKQFRLAAKDMTDTAQQAAKAGGQMQKASQHIDTAGTRAEKTGVKMEQAGQLFQQAGIYAGNAAKAFAAVNKEVSGIGKGLMKTAEPLAASLKAFRKLVTFFAQSGEAVTVAVDNVTALCGVLVKLAETADATQGRLAEFTPVLNQTAKEFAKAGNAAEKVMRLVETGALGAVTQIESFDAALGSAAGAAAEFEGKTAAIAGGLEQVAAAAEQANAALDGSAKGVRQYDRAIGPLNVPAMIAQYQAMEKQKQEYSKKLNEYYKPNVQAIQADIARLEREGENLPVGKESASNIIALNKRYDDLDNLLKEQETFMNKYGSLVGRQKILFNQIPVTPPSGLPGSISVDAYRYANKEKLLRNQQILIPQAKNASTPVPAEIEEAYGYTLDTQIAVGNQIYALKQESGTDLSRPTITPVPTFHQAYALQGEESKPTQYRYSTKFKPGQFVGDFQLTANDAKAATQNLDVIQQGVNKAGDAYQYLGKTIHQAVAPMTVIENAAKNVDTTIAKESVSVKTLGKSFSRLAKTEELFSASNFNVAISKAGDNAEILTGRIDTVRSSMDNLAKPIRVLPSEVAPANKSFGDLGLSTTKAAESLNTAKEQIKASGPAFSVATGEVNNAAKSMEGAGMAALSFGKKVGSAVGGFAKSIGSMIAFMMALKGIFWLWEKWRDARTIHTTEQENLDKLTRGFQEEQQQLQRLIQIQNAHEKTNELLEEAADIIGELQAKYGDLGLSIDRVTKSVECLTDATEVLNGLTEAQAGARYLANDKAIEELKKNEKTLLEQDKEFNDQFKVPLNNGPAIPDTPPPMVAAERYDITDLVQQYAKTDRQFFARNDWQTLLAQFLQEQGVDQTIIDSINRKSRPVSYIDQNGRIQLVDFNMDDDLQKEVAKNNERNTKLGQTRQRINDLLGQQDAYVNGIDIDVKPMEAAAASTTIDYPTESWRGMKNIPSTNDILSRIVSGDFSDLTPEGFQDYRFGILNAIDETKKERAVLEEYLKNNPVDNVAALQLVFSDNETEFLEQVDSLKQSLERATGQGGEEEQSQRVRMLQRLEDFRDAYLEAIQNATTADFDFSKFNDLTSYQIREVGLEQLEALNKQIKRVQNETMKQMEAVTNGQVTNYKIITGKDINGDNVYYEGGKEFDETTATSILTDMANEAVKPLVELSERLAKQIDAIVKTRNLEVNQEKMNLLETALTEQPEQVMRSLMEAYQNGIGETERKIGVGDEIAYRFKEIEKWAEGQNKAIEKIAEAYRADKETMVDGLPIEEWLATERERIAKDVVAAQEQVKAELQGDATAHRDADKTHDYLIEILRRLDRDYAWKRSRQNGQGGYVSQYEEEKRSLQQDYDQKRAQIEQDAQKAKEKGVRPEGQGPDVWRKQTIEELTKEFAERLNQASIRYTGVPLLNPSAAFSYSGYEQQAAEIENQTSAPEPAPSKPERSEPVDSSESVQPEQSVAPTDTSVLTEGTGAAGGGADQEGEMSIVGGVGPKKASGLSNDPDEMRRRGIEGLTPDDIRKGLADNILLKSDFRVKTADEEFNEHLGAIPWDYHPRSFFDRGHTTPDEFDLRPLPMSDADIRRRHSIREGAKEDVDWITAHPTSGSIGLGTRIWESNLSQLTRGNEPKELHYLGKQYTLGENGKYTLAPTEEQIQPLPVSNAMFEVALELNKEHPYGYYNIGPEEAWEIRDSEKQKNLERIQKKRENKKWNERERKLQGLPVPQQEQTAAPQPTTAEEPSPADTFFDNLLAGIDENDEKSRKEIERMRGVYKATNAIGNYGAAEEYLQYLQSQTNEELPEGTRLGTKDKMNRRTWIKNVRQKEKELDKQVLDEQDQRDYVNNRTPYDTENARLDNDIAQARERQEVARKMGNEQGVANEEAYIKNIERQKAENDYYKELDNIGRLERTRNKDLKEYQKNQKAVEAQEKKIERMEKKGKDTKEEEAKLEEMKAKRDQSLERYAGSNEQYGRSANYIAAMNAYGSPQAQQTLWDINRQYSSKGTFDAYETGGMDVGSLVSETKEQTVILGSINEAVTALASGEYL